MRKVYRGKDIEVSFDLDQCVHIGECLRGEPRVFQLARRIQLSAVRHVEYSQSGHRSAALSLENDG